MIDAKSLSQASLFVYLPFIIRRKADLYKEYIQKKLLSEEELKKMRHLEEELKKMPLL